MLARFIAYVDPYARFRHWREQVRRNVRIEVQVFNLPLSPPIDEYLTITRSVAAPSVVSELDDMVGKPKARCDFSQIIDIGVTRWNAIAPLQLDPLRANRQVIPHPGQPEKEELIFGCFFVADQHAQAKLGAIETVDWFVADVFDEMVVLVRLIPASRRQIIAQCSSARAMVAEQGRMRTKGVQPRGAPFTQAEVFP